MIRSRRLRHWLSVLAVAVGMGATVAAPAPAAAASPSADAAVPLQSLIDGTASGGTLRLAPGRYAGRVQIDRPMALVGEPGAVVQGSGEGSVIRVSAPDVRIEGLTIERSGVDLPAMDSAILLERGAVRAVIRSNSLRGNLFGIYVHGANDALIENNTIVGRSDLRMAEAGDGVAIWNAPGTQVISNTMRYGRDGIFVRISRRNVFAHNVLRDLRFGIHYMYTHDSRIVGNRSHGNHVAWAIMYSERIELSDNVSDDDRDHGLMLNTTNRSTVARNVVRRGREKCVFVYNANFNELRDNWFEGCPVGIHFTAGSEKNTLSGNAYVGTRMQVKYVGTRFVDWASGGRGNYWSDNPAFDLDGNGIADRPYRPNDVMDQVLWTLPAAKALANSPAVQMVRLAQAKFPALYPGGVIDSAPLMRPAFIPPPVSR